MPPQAESGAPGPRDRGAPPIGPGDVDAVFDAARAEGLVALEDRPYWSLLTERRARRLVANVRRRTRYVTVALEAVHDGHNQAAVLRSADAFGIQDVTVIRRDTRFKPSRGVTQGADRWLTLHAFEHTADAIAALRARGYRVLASHLSENAAQVDAVDLTAPIALLFGNEHEGVSDEALALADGAFQVPMVGFVQSMNVSVAAAVAMFHVTRRARRTAGSRYRLSRSAQRELLRAWVALHRPRGRPLPGAE